MDVIHTKLQIEPWFSISCQHMGIKSRVILVSAVIVVGAEERLLISVEDSHMLAFQQ